MADVSGLTESVHARTNISINAFLATSVLFGDFLNYNNSPVFQNKRSLIFFVFPFLVIRVGVYCYNWLAVRRG